MRTGTKGIVVVGLLLCAFVAGLVINGNLSGPLPVSAATTDDPNHRTISVTGTGEITVAPTICRMTIGVTTDGKTAGEAQGANNTAAQAIAAALAGLKIKTSDIQTVGFNLYPLYDDRSVKSDYPTAPVVVGYRAAHRMQVTVRDLTKVGQVIDAAVKAGANTADDITYAVEETATLRQQALTLAVKQAKAKADAIAAAAGLAITEIKTIQEHYVDYGYYRAPYAYDKAMGMGEAVPMPVLPGEIMIRASVGMVVRF